MLISVVWSDEGVELLMYLLTDWEPAISKGWHGYWQMYKWKKQCLLLFSPKKAVFLREGEKKTSNFSQSPPQRNTLALRLITPLEMRQSL